MGNEARQPLAPVEIGKRNLLSLPSAMRLQKDLARPVDAQLRDIRPGEKGSHELQSQLEGRGALPTVDALTRHGRGADRPNGSPGRAQRESGFDRRSVCGPWVGC